MLGIRTALKPSLECSAASLSAVLPYGISVILFGFSQNSAEFDPSSCVQRLRQAMTHLRATLPRDPTKTNVCTFIRSKWYSLYSVNRTNGQPQRNISQPNPAWTDYSNKMTLQRGLSIGVLIMAALTMASLAGLGVFYFYRRRFLAGTKEKRRGKYQIIYNADGNEAVGSYHPLF
ncbi:hypothetical protein SprV_0401555600 [Sparganum proliferum]